MAVQDLHGRHGHDGGGPAGTEGALPADISGRTADRQGTASRVDLLIGGMTCPHCPAMIEKALTALSGVWSAHVNLAARTASIAFDPARVTVADLLQAIRRAGYSPGAAKIRIPIANMHCSSCAVRIETELRNTPGVIKAEASALTASAGVEYRPEATTFEALKAAIARAGYRTAEPETSRDGEDGDPETAAKAAEYDLLMRKFWFAAAVSVPVMLLSYPDFIPGLRGWMPMGSETRRIVWALLGVISLPVMFWSGSQFFTGMWDGLKHRAANMNTLIAIGISAGISVFGGGRGCAGAFPAHGTRRSVLGRGDGGRCAGDAGSRARNPGEGADIRGDQ